MIGAVMDQVAALTEASQVAEPIVGRIMIKVCGRKDDTRCPYSNDLFQVRPASTAPPPVTPGLPFWIVPASIRKGAHSDPMRPAAVLTYPAGALKAHPPAQLFPVSRI